MATIFNNPILQRVKQSQGQGSSPKPGVAASSAEAQSASALKERAGAARSSVSKQMNMDKLAQLYAPVKGGNGGGEDRRPFATGAVTHSAQLAAKELPGANMKALKQASNQNRDVALMVAHGKHDQARKTVDLRLRDHQRNAKNAPSGSPQSKHFQMMEGVTKGMIDTLGALDSNFAQAGSTGKPAAAKAGANPMAHTMPGMGGRVNRISAA